MSSYANLPSTSTASGSGHSSNYQQNSQTLKIYTVLEKIQQSGLQTAAYSSVLLPYDIWTVPACSVQNSNGPMSRQYNVTFNNNHQHHSKEEASSSTFITCFRCKERAPTTRCLECNYSSCHECCLQLTPDCQLREHTLLPIHQTSPIGARRNAKEVMLCDIHGDQVRYYCEFCLVFICQECTLVLHKYHNKTPMKATLDMCRTDVLRAIEDTKTGIKAIETAIDRTVAMSKACEKDTEAANIEIRKAMRCHAQAIEDREKYLLDLVEKMRRDKMNDYTGHMITLRGMLAGLAHTHETLARSIDSKGIDLFKAKEKGSVQLDYYSCKLKNLSVKEERIVFIPPNYDLVDKMKIQCHVQLAPPSSLDSLRFTSSIPSRQSMPPLQSLQSAQNFQHHNYNMSESSRLRSLPEYGSHIRPTYYYGQRISSSLALYPKVGHGIGQAIPGYCMSVSVGPTGNPLPGIPVFSFAQEGQDKGQMSRPWGLCVDSQGNIIVADRRNNRIQIFNRRGQFKTMFGYKGAGPGELNLPAGITTDSYGRIIVVDKDNHRVQIFASNGKFVLNFGSYGMRCGQFQYPWDVAVNTLGNIVVTDTRNHRIQMFTSAGIFIKMFVFEGGRANKMLKGATIPRGVCFMKSGTVLVSDFENHRLLMLDPTLSKVLYCVGREGSGIGELNRPSGIVTDDYGRIIVADSKNHRLLVFTPELRIMGVVILKTPELDDTGGPRNVALKARPSDMALTVRPSDVALTPEGHVIVVSETMRGTAPVISHSKHYIKVFML